MFNCTFLYYLTIFVTIRIISNIVLCKYDNKFCYYILLQILTYCFTYLLLHFTLFCLVIYSLICFSSFQLKFDDLVPTSEEVEALSLEEFSFNNLGDVDESDVPSDDDFVDPPSRHLSLKTVSP